MNKLEQTTRTYTFDETEQEAIRICCKLADAIDTSETLNYHNPEYSVEDFFHRMYDYCISKNKAPECYVLRG